MNSLLESDRSSWFFCNVPNDLDAACRPAKSFNFILSNSRTPTFDLKKNYNQFVWMLIVTFDGNEINDAFELVSFSAIERYTFVSFHCQVMFGEGLRMLSRMMGPFSGTPPLARMRGLLGCAPSQLVAFQVYTP
jgi:hypothetical protein